MTARRLAAPLAALLLLAACRPPVAPAPPPPPPPIARETVTAEDLLRRLRVRARALRSFRALAVMEYRGPKDRLRVTEVIVVRRPADLRIEMMSAFGLALVIATDGESVFAYHRGEKTFYRGTATAANLARFTRLDLDVRDVASLLVGLVPLRKLAGTPRAEREAATGLRRLSLPIAGDGTVNVWFEAERMLPVRSEELDRGGGRRWSVELSSYRRAGDVDLPLRVVLDAPDVGATVSLDYSEVTANAALGDELFALAPPAGSKEVDLDVAPPPAPPS